MFKPTDDQYMNAYNVMVNMGRKMVLPMNLLTIAKTKFKRLPIM